MAIYQATIEIKDDTRSGGELLALKIKTDALISDCLDQAGAGMLYGSSIRPDGKVDYVHGGNVVFRRTG